MGTKATDYMHGLKALTPDASDIAGLRESQKNVANNTPTTPPPAPATPATVYPQDKLHPSENYKYGNQGGQKRLDMEGNIIPVPAYDSGRDVRVISPMIYDEGGEVDPAIAAGRAGQAQGNSMVQSLMAEPDVQAPDQAALNMPKPVKPAAKLAAKPAPASGSVGGVRDQQLDAPQYMQPTNDQLHPVDVAAPSQMTVMTGQPASALPQMNDAVPVMDCGGNVGIQAYDDGGPVNVNDGQHQLAILKHGEKVLNPREADAYRAGQQAAAAQAAPPAEGASPEGAQPDAQAAPVEGQPAEGMPQEKPEAATADPHIAQAAAKHYGLEEQPEEPVVKGTAAERKAINVDKKQAMGTGNLVKLGTALLNERHLSPMPTELKVYDDGGYVAPTLTPEQIEQQKLNARLADQNDTRGPQPTAKTTPSVVSENTVSARPQMTSGNLEQGAAPPDNFRSQFNHGNGGLTDPADKTKLVSGRSMEEGATAPSALKPAGLKPMVAPEQAATPAVGLPSMQMHGETPAMPTYGGPGKAVPQGQAIPAKQLPQDERKAKLKAYDTQIQANLDLATPEGKEAADRLTLAKASYEKNNPWGSAANHPGFLGKLGHVAAEIGNTAGNIVAPGVMAEIPGTEMNRAERNANTRAQVNEDTALNTARMAEETKANTKAVTPGKTTQEQTYADLMAGDNGKPRINPDTKLPFTAQEANIASQGTSKTPEELYIQEQMRGLDPATGKHYSRQQAEEAYLQMKAGNKPPNEQERRVKDYLESRGLPDLPANREKARTAIKASDTTATQQAALPFSEQKAKFNDALTTTRELLVQQNADADTRGEKADELQNTENARYAKVAGQITTAKDALNASDEQFSNQIVPIVSLLAITSAEGVKRVNKQELDKFVPTSGNFGRWIEGHADQFLEGKIPENYRAEVGHMLDRMEAAQDVEHKINTQSVDTTIRQGAQQPVQRPEGGAKANPEKSKPQTAPQGDLASGVPKESTGTAPDPKTGKWYYHDSKGNILGEVPETKK